MFCTIKDEPVCIDLILSENKWKKSLSSWLCLQKRSSSFFECVLNGNLKKHFKLHKSSTNIWKRQEIYTKLSKLFARQNVTVAKMWQVVSVHYWVGSLQQEIFPAAKHQMWKLPWQRWEHLWWIFKQNPDTMARGN